MKLDAKYSLYTTFLLKRILISNKKYSKCLTFVISDIKLTRRGVFKVNLLSYLVVMIALQAGAC